MVNSCFFCLLDIFYILFIVSRNKGVAMSKRRRKGKRLIKVFRPRGGIRL